jgi:predicted transcriptional regulator
MTKSLTEMAAEIASAQAGHATMTAEEMQAFLSKTFQVLKQIKAVEDGGVAVELAEHLDPKTSIQRNKVICLECGKEFKLLTRAHLGSHGLTAKEYRKKYGFQSRQALTAKSLSAKRRKRAKELGLGDRLKKARGKKV